MINNMFTSTLIDRCAETHMHRLDINVLNFFKMEYIQILCHKKVEILALLQRRMTTNNTQQKGIKQKQTKQTIQTINI